MANLPSGTVTFLFTDIEGSTRLLQQLGDRYTSVLADHHRLLRAAFQDFGGHEVDTQGEAFFFTFVRARDAVAAAIEAQRVLARHPWPEGAIVRVRMGVHTGEPLSVETGYVGMDVHRAARICAAGHGGQILLSDTTHALIVKNLPDGIGLRDLGEHRLRDLAHAHRLFQVVAAGLPTDFPPVRSLDAHPHNLPIQLTSFIGRVHEMADVKRLLSTTRLLTLTGVGGSGKTRLALQVAAELIDEYPDGIWLVDLAALADPDLVPHAVASALRVPEQPGRSLMETLADSLTRKRLLLVLDNCEHLLPACATLAETFLRTCPSMRILATSREDLGVAAERVYPVPTLSVPDPGQLPLISNLPQYDAVRLFTERAAEVLPIFRVTPQNAHAVAQICHRLDGIPLAIELAAARVKVLAVEQLVSRLDDRFRLLTGRTRTALPRHQTLRAAMDWSYDLLGEKERAVLQRLSVFAGGCLLEAAETVCSGNGVEVPEILDLLTQLVDKSLVVVEEHGQAVRYRLLETVREYARERLLKSGEEARVRRKHRDWYLRLAEQAEQEVHGTNPEAWRERLETEHDNLRAALKWSLAEVDGAEAGLRLAGALGGFWYVRADWSEGRRWLEAALERGASASGPARAKAYRRAGVLAWVQGDFGRAASLLEESLTLYREVQDDHGIAHALYYLGLTASDRGEYARAATLLVESLHLLRRLGERWEIAELLNSLGNLAMNQGEYRRAAALFDESLSLSRELGDSVEAAYALNHMGELARLQGDYERAEALLQESLALHREVGEKQGIAQALNNLGDVASARGDYARAVPPLEESLALSREVVDKWNIAFSLNYLGVVALRQGGDKRAAALLEESLALRREMGYKKGIATTLNNLAMVVGHQGGYERAASLLRESLALRRQLGEVEGIARSLEGFAWLSCARGQPARAARLFGAAETIRDEIGAPRPPADCPLYDRLMAAARAGLQDGAFAASQVAGWSMTLEQAIEYALSDS